MPKYGYQSQQIVMAAILDYLYSKEKEIGWVIKYHIKTKTPKIHSQTDERISQILGDLVKRGLLETSPSGDRTLYRISENGKRTYDKWMLDFLQFSGYPTQRFKKSK